jgi:hypothetical protein
MQRFALTLVQGARGSGKSTLLDAALAGADHLGVVRLAVSRTADLGGELTRLAGSAIDRVVAELGGARRADGAGLPVPRTDGHRRLSAAAGRRRARAELPRRRYYGQPWADLATNVSAAGVLGNARLGENWDVAAAVFHASRAVPQDHAEPFVDTQPDGATGSS